MEPVPFCVMNLRDNSNTLEHEHGDKRLSGAAGNGHVAVLVGANGAREHMSTTTTTTTSLDYASLEPPNSK
jgi:hypothetical protein